MRRGRVFRAGLGTFGFHVAIFQRRALRGCSIGHFCYDKDTRVLTKDGLKSFSALAEDDEIATLNPETDELEWNRPNRVFEYDYTGPLLHFKQRTMELMVTPNHRIYCRNRNGSDKFQLIEAKIALDRWKAQDIQFKRNCTWNCAQPTDFALPQDLRADLFQISKHGMGQ